MYYGLLEMLVITPPVAWCRGVPVGDGWCYLCINAHTRVFYIHVSTVTYLAEN